MSLFSTRKFLSRFRSQRNKFSYLGSSKCHIFPPVQVWTQEIVSSTLRCD